MTLPRRRFLHLAASVVAFPAVPSIAQAQIYPSRPVKIVVGFPAGGVGDLVARLMARRLAERLGRPFVIEDRPGVAGNIAAELVVRASPDGYTLLELNAPNAINATLYANLNFDLVRDLAPVAGIMRVPAVMEVNPSFPAKTVPEFIAYAKANPGKINMASGGNGSTPHVYGELFKMMTGVNMIHVPYRGSPMAMTDLLGGQVQVMFDPLPSSIEQIRAGRLRPLAVTTSARLEVLPDVPALSEFVPGYEASGWQGVAAPSATPVEIIDKLNKEIGAVLIEPEMKARIADLGGTTFSTSPAEFAKFVADETEKWAKVVKFAGIKSE